MIAQAFRFRGHSSVDKLYRRAQTLRGSALSLKFATQNNQRGYKAAIVVSRKVSKSAVVRNRIRRRIYEVVRSYDKLESLAGLQLVFIVYSDTLASLEAARLHDTVFDLLQRARSADAAGGRAIVNTERER